MRALPLTLALALAAPVLAEEEEEAPSHESRTLPRGSFDLHGAVGTDVLLQELRGALALDYGVLDFSNGSTISAGVELGFGQCLLGCGTWAASEAILTRHLAPSARFTFHFPLSSPQGNISAIDTYLVAVAGAAFVTSEALSASGSGWGPLGSFGIGSLYFPGNGDTIFAAGEFRFTYAAGVHPMGGGTLPWSLTGFVFTFAIGARL